MEPEDFLTIPEAAKELGLAESTIHNALYEKRLAFTRLYGRKLIARTEVDAYKQRTRPDGEKPRGRPRKPVEERIFEYRGRKVVIRKAVVTTEFVGAGMTTREIDQCLIDGQNVAEEISENAFDAAKMGEWVKTAKAHIDAVVTTI